ncbi:uncharacterized protein LOC122066524 isoform X1 [Macadamia integrifolia]|uniref:uncharacterized protein LOC122066524 isoform X1 n=1 Tax=Macadamia integrifolia TaxID=60698 RepID=UPI001C4E9C04|nr:uncharacterized protein LOC122066524 isoform X1 [Macadamia integrifolia]
MFFQVRTRRVDPSIVQSHISAIDPSQVGPSTNVGGSLRVVNIPFRGFPAWCYPNAANLSLPHLLELKIDVDASLELPIPYDYVSPEVNMRSGGCITACARQWLLRMGGLLPWRAKLVPMSRKLHNKMY